MSLQAQLVIGPYRANAKPHLEGGVAHSFFIVCDAALSGDCLLPALVHRTFACRSASLWTASSSARQTAHLSVSISTMATKHLPGLHA